MINLENRRGLTNLVRLIAAVSVLVSHSFPLTGSGPDPIVLFAPLGEIAVSIFFVLSGYFIYRSSINRDTKSYILLRIGRLFPGLIFVNFVSALFLFPVFSSYSFKDYLSLRSDGPLSYVFFNSILLFGLQANIGDLLSSLPYPSVINGSLWTLPTEFKCYLLLGFLAILGRRVKSRIPFFVVSTLICILYFSVSLKFVNFNGLPLTSLRLIVIFLSGALLASLNFRLPQNAFLILAISCALVFISLQYIEVLEPFIYVVIIFLVHISTPNFAKRFHFFKDFDYSYGFYLWAFPIQQLIMHSQLTNSAFILILIAIPICFLFAGISWHLVEKPILHLIRKRLVEEI
jgi:peptidoglycan/LPS O-acetylase OafA/YrhL